MGGGEKNKCVQHKCFSGEICMFPLGLYPEEQGFLPTVDTCID